MKLEGNENKNMDDREHLKTTKIIKNKKVTFKFKGKKYIVKTNKRGYATLTLKLKLKVGNYKIYTSYGKSKATNKITVKK